LKYSVVVGRESKRLGSRGSPEEKRERATGEGKTDRRSARKGRRDRGRKKKIDLAESF